MAIIGGRPARTFFAIVKLPPRPLQGYPMPYTLCYKLISLMQNTLQKLWLNPKLRPES